MSSSSFGSVRRRLGKVGAVLAVVFSGLFVAGVTSVGVAHASLTPIDTVHTVTGCTNYVSSGQLTYLTSISGNGVDHYTIATIPGATVTLNEGKSIVFDSPNDPVLYVVTNVGYIENYDVYTTAFATPENAGGVDISNAPRPIGLNPGLPSGVFDFGFCFASVAVTTNPTSPMQLGRVPQSQGTSKPFTVTVQNHVASPTPVEFSVDPSNGSDFVWNFTSTTCTDASGAQVQGPYPFTVSAVIDPTQNPPLTFPPSSVAIPASSTCQFTGVVAAATKLLAGAHEARLVVASPRLSVTPNDATAVVPDSGEVVKADVAVGGFGVGFGAPTFSPDPPTAKLGGTTPVSWTLPAYDLENGYALINQVDCVPASGSQFPIGQTDVTCTASANDGATNTTTFIVNVSQQFVPDPPTIISAVPTPGGAGTVDVTFSAPAYDGGSPITQYYLSLGDGPVDYSDTLFTPAPGDPGPYTVTLDGTIRGGTPGQSFYGSLPLGTPLTPTVAAINTNGWSDLATGAAVRLDPPGTSGGQSQSGTDPTASSTATNGVSTAVSASGTGTVSTSQYSGGLPANVVSPPFGFVKGGGLPTSPFDVLVSRGNGFTSLSITSCQVPNGTTLWWYEPNSASWLPVVPDATNWNVLTQCLTDVLSFTSSPSITDLTGTIFALATAPDATTSTVIASPTSVAAGGTSTVTVTVLDSSGNPVPQALVNLTASSSAPAQSATADDNGVATFTVSDSAGTVTYSATANDVPIGSASVEYTSTNTGTAPTVSASPSVGEVGIAYSLPLTITGDPAPTVSLTGAPSWLTLSNGTLSGTPTSAGSFSFSVDATNSAGSSSTPVTIVVQPSPSISTATLPSATSGQAYSAPLAASGGVGAFTWSATGLPVGFSIDPSTGAISGSPTTAGSSSVSVSVTDGLGGTASQSYTLVVAAGAPATGVLSAPSAIQLVSTPVAVTVTVKDANSNLVPGATISLTGGPSALSAVTDANGVASFSVSSSTSGAVTYTASSGATTLTSGQVTYGTAPTVSATAPAAEVGVATSFNATSTGSPAPTIGFVGLPSWLSYDTTTGVLSGTPTSSGSFSFTIAASNDLGTATKQVTVAVSPALTVTTATLPQGTAGSAYNVTAATSGGVGVVHWSATGLPAPLVINPNTGAITGTPLAASSSSVTITATDSLGANSTATLTLTVAAAPPPPPSGADLSVSLTASRVVSGESFDLRVKVTNTGTQATSGTITVVDDLPFGFTYRGSTGTGWRCSAVGQHVVCTSTASLAAGRSTSFTVTVRANVRVGTVFTDSASVSGAFIDPTPADDRATVTSTVVRG